MTDIAQPSPAIIQDLYYIGYGLPLCIAQGDGVIEETVAAFAVAGVRTVGVIVVEVVEEGECKEEGGAEEEGRAVCCEAVG